MATARDLVQGECGGANPLMKMTSHFAGSQKHSGLELARRRAQDGATFVTEGDALAHEFLVEKAITFEAPGTFGMESLLDGLRGSTLPTRQGESWAREFHQTSTQSHHPQAKQWVTDFEQVREQVALDPLWNSMNKIGQDRTEEKWASEYLEDQGLYDTNLEKHDKIFSSSDWVDEFADLTDTDLEKLASAGDTIETYKQDFWKNLETEWQSLSQKSEAHPWLTEFNDWQPKWEYEFQKDNPLQQHAQALQEGKDKLKEGDIPSAVLLFEAAVTQEPSNAEAWSLLGTTQAKNENDPAAIAALRRALELEPGNLNNLLSLAVSYTNESYQAQACRTLQDWMQSNLTYAHLMTAQAKESSSPSEATSSFMSQALHQSTKDDFLAAARLNADAGTCDADIQSALGILFNLSGDYDKATDCFQAALQVRPDDAMLWNRLGATLANGNKSVEAVNAYRQALHHMPGFIRSRYNLGISCINLKAYSEAAQHFLTALKFQSLGRGPQGSSVQSSMSEGIWSSLRLSLSLMDRQDLHPMVDDRRLDSLCQEFGVKMD